MTTAMAVVMKVNVCAIDCEAVSVAVTVIVDAPAVAPGVMETVESDTETVATAMLDDRTAYVSASVSLKYEATATVCTDAPTCTDRFGIVPTRVGGGLTTGAAVVVKVNVCVMDCEAVSVAVTVMVDVPAVAPGVIVMVDPDTDTATTFVFDEATPYVSASVSVK